MAIEDLRILIPVYNDWESIAALLPLLDDALTQAAPLRATVYLVDDGSTTEPRETFTLTTPLRAIERVLILPLRRNLGHQRAIAIGLAYLDEHDPGEAVVVMDGDGEDQPEDVPRLIRHMHGQGNRCIVFAARARRTEGVLFLCFYRTYCFLHWVLTGVRVRFGNFSIIPRPALRRLVVVSDLWNHYAASVLKARLTYDSIPTHRGTRLAGKSHMNFGSLVGHGLSAMSVFGEVIGVRLLIVVLGCMLPFLALLAGAQAYRILLHTAIPVWLSVATGLAVIGLGQAVTLAVVFVFIILHTRSSYGFVPIRDYQFFVEDPVEITLPGRPLKQGF